MALNIPGPRHAPGVVDHDAQQAEFPRAGAVPTPARPESEPGEFFQAGRTYGHGQDGYAAPELTSVFRVEHITRHPDRGHLRAIGWVKSGEPDALWHGTFYDEHEFAGWVDITNDIVEGGQDQ